MLKQTLQSVRRKLVSSADGTHRKIGSLAGNSITRFRSRSTQIDIAASIPRERVECLVVGAGVVGIAIARSLALKGREVLVIESAPTFGTATSSRNSEVLHAGIYYPRNSFKVSKSDVDDSVCLAIQFLVLKLPNDSSS